MMTDIELDPVVTAELAQHWSNIEGIRLQPIMDMQSGKEVGREGLSALSSGYSAERYFSTLSAQTCLLNFFDQADFLQQRSLPGTTFLNLPARVFASRDCVWQLLQVHPSYRKGLAIEFQDPAELTVCGNRTFNIIKRSIHALRRIGWAIWLDDLTTAICDAQLDMGIQYDGVKIDKTEIVAGCHNPAALQRLVNKARVLTVKPGQILAEGIETVAELNIARTCGVTLGQGFLWPQQTIMWRKSFAG